MLINVWHAGAKEGVCDREAWPAAVVCDHCSYVNITRGMVEGSLVFVYSKGGGDEEDPAARSSRCPLLHPHPSSPLSPSPWTFTGV